MQNLHVKRPAVLARDIHSTIIPLFRSCLAIQVESACVEERIGVISKRLGGILGEMAPRKGPLTKFICGYPSPLICDGDFWIIYSYTLTRDYQLRET